ncbi:uncharacterized protein ARMOST_07637 [Armillaria ostoyae]|uniref:Peptidase S8/S53 domain-containing protein n=1 Tax=Armillaria ostoyae TaxID=47428 RepID=A0A284R6C4_ARMOS|nr:uncharacterized protein ARMOST_07637 [Armillaria ostoyae]
MAHRSIATGVLNDNDLNSIQANPGEISSVSYHIPMLNRVCGTVGGTQYSVAKSVHLIAVKVLDDYGSGYISNIFAGLEWVIDAPPVNHPLFLFPWWLRFLYITVINAGIHVVVAAGTDECVRHQSRSIADARAAFSYYGQGHSVVNIFALGQYIKSSWIGGTTVHHAAISALIKSLGISGAMIDISSGTVNLLANNILSITGSFTRGISFKGHQGIGYQTCGVPLIIYGLLNHGNDDGRYNEYHSLCGYELVKGSAMVTSGQGCEEGERSLDIGSTHGYKIRRHVFSKFKHPPEYECKAKDLTSTPREPIPWPSPFASFNPIQHGRAVYDEDDTAQLDGLSDSWSNCGWQQHASTESRFKIEGSGRVAS